MFKNPFSFDGRIRRLEFGLTMIIYMVIYLSVLGIVAASGSEIGMLAFLIFIPLVWFVWAQGAKRCHDLGRSGWFQLIPFYGLIMLFHDGDPGRNEYGFNAKGVPGPDGQLEGSEQSETLDSHLIR